MPSTPPPAPGSNTVVVDLNLTGGAPFIPFTEQSYRLLNQLVLPAIYAELVRMDSKGNYIPYLAINVPTIGNNLVRFVGQGDTEHLEVEFLLRPNLLWQDGQLLTAEDLVFSWNLVMDPDWPGLHYGQVRPAAAEVYVAAKTVSLEFKADGKDYKGNPVKKGDKGEIAINGCICMIFE